MGYRLIDAEGMVVRAYPAKRFLKPGESCVRAEVLDTESLREGTYDLQVERLMGAVGSIFRRDVPFFWCQKICPRDLRRCRGI